MINKILPAYYFTLECVFLYFLFFLFYTFIGEIPSILSFLVIIFIANLVLHFGLRRKNITGTLPYIAAILSGLTSYFLGFSPSSVLLTTVFVFFRVSAFLKDSSLWRMERTKLALLFYCSGIILSLEGWMLNYPHMNALYVVMIVFTILLSLGSFLQHIEGTKVNRNILEFATVLGSAVVITGVLTPLFPLVKGLFRNMFEGLMILLSMVTMPLFYFLETNKVAPPARKLEDNAEKQKEATQTMELLNFSHNIPPWVWFVFLVLVLIVIWLIVKEMKMEDTMVKNDEVATLKIDYTPSSISTGKKRRFFRQTDPHEYVRKLFYQFQIFAEMHGFGRYEHETIREWFDRVGFQKDEDLFLAYESVRYGGKVIHKQDAKRYENLIQGIKLEVKERTKKK
jgi:hypothetical protein